MLDLVLNELFLELTRHRVTPLYTQVDARRLTEPRPAHTQRVRLGDVSYMPCITSLFIHGGLYLRALSRLQDWAYCKPNCKPSSCILLDFI